MRIRVEAGSLLRDTITGVGYYTKSLINTLKNTPTINIETFSLPVNRASSEVTVITGWRKRTYDKLNQFGIAPVFDSKLDPVDLTIFPDFALWPTKNSKINAVVIHDLTYLKYPEYMRVRKIGPIKLPVTTWYLSRIVKQSAKKADFIITVSETTKKDIAKLFGISEEKIVVTEIPPSNEFLAQKNTLITKPDLRKKYAIPTKNYILSVGTIEPRKNQLATLRAYLLLPSNIKKTHSLVFAGGLGWSNDVFIEEVHKAQSKGEHIVLTNYFDINDSYGLYKHASLFTSASHYEGFGMPVLEAMAAGTPTVLSDIPVYREIAGTAALYINASKPTGYASTLQQALLDTDLRTEKINESSKQLQHYSWKNNVKRIIDKACQEL